MLSIIIISGSINNINIYKNGYNGYLLDDIDEFKDKILYIIKNEDLFIKNSREFAEKFTWDKTAEMWYKSSFLIIYNYYILVA